MGRHYDAAWRDGVDRWYGQSMTEEQLDLIAKYHQDDPGEVPPWVYGLRHILTGKEWDFAGYLEWDYGLDMDLELLCHHRRGRLPFEFMLHLWHILGARRDRLRNMAK